MSRFRSPAVALLVLSLTLVTSGCMNQPMYQPYPYGYNQPMYGQPGYSQPGTLVIPQTNAPPYVPGGTYESDPLKRDDFNAGSGSSNDSQFFKSDEAGGVPDPKDSTNSTRDQFNRELSPP